jgi:D-alanyl-D-alanine dipeptidase
MNNTQQLIQRSRHSFKQAATHVPIHDNGEKLIDQTRIEQLGLMCQPFWQEADDLEGKCYRSYIIEHPNFSLCLRSSVVERLVAVQTALPDNWVLVLKAGFRPPSVQLALLDALKNDIKDRNPDLTDEGALEAARQYVADPSRSCPPHTTGGAVDVDIIDVRSGIAVDMGCPPNTDDERAALHSTVITPKQYENRLMLLNAMLKARFAPLHNEWWHYSYGETRWAAFYGEPETFYGVIND